jgi:uncharacterized membrane protein
VGPLIGVLVGTLISIILMVTGVFEKIVDWFENRRIPRGW